MLCKLYIENVAVIEKTEINFGLGFNVLTGETGAGKSIIIDSIDAVLGKRISRDIIRSGSKTAFVSATFLNLSNELISLMETYGFNVEDNGEIIIQREISLEGKSNARINSRPVAISVLKEIGEKIINIHGQHESYGLFSPEMHLKFLDEFGNLEDDLKLYKESFENLKALKKEIMQLEVDESEKARRIDLLQYQISDLESANLVEGEREELELEKSYLLNREKIINSVDHAKLALDGDENSVGAISLLETASNKISSLKDIYPEVTEISERLNNLFYEIKDCQSELSGLLPDEDVSLTRIDEIEERLSVLSNLSKKYGPKVQDMLNFLEKAKLELEKIEMSDKKIESLKDEFNQNFNKTKKLAKALSEKRKQSAKKFINQVKSELRSLDMSKVSFEVFQRECNLCSSGCDELEILISTNPGQPPKSISKIASGGELSRLMLAIKNALSSGNDVQTLIFDEIDTGISGSAAQKVGIKLKELSNSRQVICVTHLAQIAALADEHFLITKDVSQNKTFTKIQKLNFECRKKEIARIIGGTNISDIMLKNAEEMLKSKAMAH